MGIYSSCGIYGIRIYNYIDCESDEIVIHYETQTDIVLSNEIIKKARSVYDELYKKNPEVNYCFDICNEYSSTYSRIDDNYMDWRKIPLNIFLEKFN
jgi:hypothetical protein